MPDTILDDVQALLDKEVGDKRILEQILRAAQNNEVISNFERNYVRKLAEKHLGKKPAMEKKPEEQKIIPDVQIPTPTPPQPKPVQTFSPPPKVSKSNSKNTKIMLGAGIAALIVIIAAAASMSGVSDISSTPNITKTPTSQSFSIQTDLSSYQRGDIISISGNSEFSAGEPVNLVIKNPDDETVWSEQVAVKKDGKFTTLTFAGGSGWDAGIFTVMAETNSEQTTNTFSFN
ncbi:MAG: hypothetical protein GTN35_00565 [Nitrososphaeria archaeon]|nr:hypothetical protein [Nitrosopumilaceae archaeon]NIP10504.1 hypothetical protein [Nitrosopumilaceae archaeon]NIP90914.1 hypothetical protein [Nitrososphaeria archaeon]NIS94530.1 hypothetical protein [Nitrosopumilaceae archaeon]